MEALPLLRVSLSLLDFFAKIFPALIRSKPVFLDELRKPIEPSSRICKRLVLCADPSCVPDAVEVVAQKFVVDLAGPGFVPARIIR